MAEADAGVLGCDPNRTILFAQVRSGQPQMCLDKDGHLRLNGISDKRADVYLGDVANVTLRALGPHDPPRFIEEPGYDEQRWEMKSRAGEVEVCIKSEAYWGFGLLARCFYNRIELIGPLSLRARIVHDIVASLGRNPWEASWVTRFEKISGTKSSEHASAWEELIEFARAEMEREIQSVNDAIRALLGTDEAIAGILETAQYAIEDARAALADRNAPAVERALGRAISALIEADPETEVRSSEFEAMHATFRAPSGKDSAGEIRAEDLLKNEIEFVDLTESE